MLAIMKTISHFGYDWQHALPYLLLIGGAIGIIASFALTYDKIHLLQNPAYQPSCNLNPVFSCMSVMKSAQANILGAPNTVFGLIAFTAVTMLGAMVLAGAVCKRWFWQIAQLVATMGIVFMHYLFFEAVFRIHAICPWCFLVWMVTIPVFFGLTIYNLRQGNLKFLRFRLLAPFIDHYNIDILVLWYLIIFVILLIKFWYYWQTLLPWR